jgi:hypothetical protein
MVGFLVHNIDSLLLAVADSCTMLDDVERHSVIQTFAYRLEERYGISRDQLRIAMKKIGFTLEEFCIGCNQQMPSFTGNGNPVCDDCKLDIDSVG